MNLKTNLKFDRLCVASLLFASIRLIRHAAEQKPQPQLLLNVHFLFAYFFILLFSPTYSVLLQCFILFRIFPFRIQFKLISFAISLKSNAKCLAHALNVFNNFHIRKN